MGYTFQHYGRAFSGLRLAEEEAYEAAKKGLTVEEVRAQKERGR